MSTLSELMPGTVFAGSYRIVRKLAEGGMGAVYVADQLTTGRQRALKLMHPVYVGSPELRERFALEARVGALVESEHVVEVIGAGVDDDVPWIAMELLSGKDLASELRACGRLSEADCGRVLGQVGHALTAAHRAGIVHRDLKPENVFLAHTKRVNESTTVKLLDFGIAKLVEAALSANTGAVGTPLWMAPEQSERDAPITPSVDVWALGLLAFTMLTGKPFWLAAASPEGSLATILREVVLSPIPPASARARELGVGDVLPVGFDAWFARCVCRDPSGRFAHAGLAIAHLPEALAHRPSLPVPLRTSSPGSAPSAPDADGATDVALARTTDASISDLAVSRTPGPSLPSPKAPTPSSEVDDDGPEALPIDGGSSSRLVVGGGVALVVFVAFGAVLARRSGAVSAPADSGAGAAPSSSLPFCPHDMARIKAETFTMGSDENGPPRLVRASPSCVDLTEVTAQQYATCVAKKLCPPPVAEAALPGAPVSANKAWSAYCTYAKPGRGDHPMTCVSFDEAAAYCRSVGKRLPREDEWEHAARGADGRRYPWGNEPPSPGAVNACDEGCLKLAREASADVLGARLVGDDGAEATAPVGAFLRGVSPFGVFDMAGNAAEWVDATFCPYDKPSCAATTKVVRGGSWADDRANGLTTSARGKASPETRMPDIGFRCAKD